ncbi:MAG: hypothetical protein AMK73_01150 [Planctomycetes bacterium SM23_32]|nr:MAG: hypothetical protein AMK73_01150 [Planctomycetes bacterium SM23_32]
MAVWTLAEQAGGRLKRVSYELLTWGRHLADGLEASGRPAELCAIALGARLREEDLEELTERGADRVCVAESPGLDPFLVEAHAGVLEMLVRWGRPEIIIAAATTAGRTLMPYLAVRLETGLTADCTRLEIDPDTGHLVQIRPAAGGKVLATIMTADHRPQMATVRPHAAQPPPRRPAAPALGACITRVDVPDGLAESPVEWLALRAEQAAGAAVQDAERVVAGGRGLKRAEGFGVVRNLARALEAAVGASREAVDRGWIGYPHQVGLSGKTVTPRLYVAVGISGAIQHLAGMQTADVIVAVNEDADAQIFQVADLGVVGDLFEVVPALVEEVERRRAAREGDG